ncbi:MAG TPA: class I SAM-dependent methyltransferase [Pirellulales bacterium]|nr:class I SAM-dependent methyltransferase [Pirellulales bacterium]
MDSRSHNRAAWNKKAEEHDRWTVPVSSEAIEQARHGQFRILLTPTKPVPMAWFPLLQGTPALCLASGGGQQGPLLAAAGAVVTVFDNSPRQLEQDRFVAKGEGLAIETVEGDMLDLSVFADETFELIVHPCSNCFVPAVRPVWRECFRVLQRGGVLLAGFVNPVRYLFNADEIQNGNLAVCHRIPYSDLRDLDGAELRRIVVDPGAPLEFGHTLNDQIGGQLDAGFLLTSVYEDHYAETDGDPLSRYIDSFMATRAIKPHRA